MACALRDEILAGALPPGTRLPEEQLAARFGVARPTVRAAVQTLVFEGLLRRERSQSAHVPRLTADDVRDLFLARTALELEAIHILVERGVRPLGAERELERLEVQTGEQTWSQVVDAAIGFHRGLVEAVESSRLSRVFGALEGEVRLCFAHLKLANGGLPADRTVEHRRIFELIVDRDADGAVGLMREHLASGARLSLQFPLKTGT